MQAKLFIGILFFFVSMLFNTSVSGQDKVSEDEVQIQESFIEAKKQRLLGNLDKALEIFEELWRDHSGIPAIAYEIAGIYEEQEEMSKALEFAQKAYALEETNEWCLRLLARLYEKMGQNRDAAEMYDQIVRLDPEQEASYTKWAYLLTKGDQIEKAIAVYDLMEKRFGINEDIIRQKYTLYLGSGEEKRAEKELQRLVDAFPGETSYLEMLAGYYEQVGEAKEAEAVFRRILKLDPSNATAKMALAGQSSAASDEVRFLESLQDVFANEEVDIDLKIERIQPLVNKAVKEQEAILAKEILELSVLLEAAHADQAEAFGLSGKMLLLLGRLTEAEGKYKQALDLDETRFAYWEQLMKIEWERKDFKALDNTSMDAMDIFPNQPICYYFNGMSLLEMGDYDGALSVLDQALLMSESNPGLLQDIQVGVAQAWEGLEKPEKASDAFEAALKVNAENPKVLSVYAEYLANQGQRLDQAREMAEKAVKIDAGNPHLKRAQAWVEYRSENFRNARKIMETALNEGLSTDPLTLEQYGDILFQLGETEQALEFWNKAKQNGRASKSLDKKISEKRLN